MSPIAGAGEGGRADELRSRGAQAKEDRRLLKKAADALAEIDRSHGLSDEHADVLAALRIRLEGKRRASLDDLLSATGDIAGKKRDLGDALTEREGKTSDWPTVEEKKRDWPV